MASTDELMQEIERALSSLLKNRGYHSNEVKICMGHIQQSVCQRFQGDQIRIKKPIQNKARRNKEIKKMFNGTNASEVCERFDVSPSTVYRVIKK